MSDVTIMVTDVITLCARVSWTRRGIDKGHPRTGRDETTGKIWKLNKKISYLFWIGLSFFEKYFFCTKILSHAQWTMVTMVMQCFVVIFGTEID